LDKGGSFQFDSPEIGEGLSSQFQLAELGGTSQFGYLPNWRGLLLLIRLGWAELERASPFNSTKAFELKREAPPNSARSSELKRRLLRIQQRPKETTPNSASD